VRALSLIRQAFCFRGRAICCKGRGWGASGASRFAWGSKLFASGSRPGCLGFEAKRLGAVALGFEVRSKKTRRSSLVSHRFRELPFSPRLALLLLPARRAEGTEREIARGGKGGRGVLCTSAQSLISSQHSRRPKEIPGSFSCAVKINPEPYVFARRIGGSAGEMVDPRIQYQAACTVADVSPALSQSNCL